MALTDKEKLFCINYLIDKNAAQAAIRSGYSKHSAKEIGYELLTKLHVRTHIKAEIQKQQKRTEVTADKVIKELGKLAYSNLEDYMTIGEDGNAYVDLSMLTSDQAAALSEITVEEYSDGKGKGVKDVKRVKIKLNDKHGPLNTLSKHFKLLTDKMEHSGKVQIDFLTQAAKKAREVADDGH